MERGWRLSFFLDLYKTVCIVHVMRIITELHVQLNGAKGGYDVIIESTFICPSPVTKQEFHIQRLSELPALIKQTEESV